MIYVRTFIVNCSDEVSRDRDIFHESIIQRKDDDDDKCAIKSLIGVLIHVAKIGRRAPDISCRAAHHHSRAVSSMKGPEGAHDTLLGQTVIYRRVGQASRQAVRQSGERASQSAKGVVGRDSARVYGSSRVGAPANVSSLPAWVMDRAGPSAVIGGSVVSCGPAGRRGCGSENQSRWKRRRCGGRGGRAGEEIRKIKGRRERLTNKGGGGGQRGAEQRGNQVE